MISKKFQMPKFHTPKKPQRPKTNDWNLVGVWDLASGISP